MSADLWVDTWSRLRILLAAIAVLGLDYSIGCCLRAPETQGEYDKLDARSTHSC